MPLYHFVVSTQDTKPTDFRNFTPRDSEKRAMKKSPSIIPNIPWRKCFWLTKKSQDFYTAVVNNTAVILLGTQMDALSNTWCNCWIHPHWDWEYNYCRTVLEYEIRKSIFIAKWSERMLSTDREQIFCCWLKIENPQLDSHPKNDHRDVGWCYIYVKMHIYYLLWMPGSPWPSIKSICYSYNKIIES